MLPAGAVIGGEYRLVRLLGRGGMGEVYEAVHERLQRRVAVKTIRPEIAVDPAALARFRREAETAASLGHPNIVQVTDWKEMPGEPPFLVMECLEGLALADVIDQERKLGAARTAFIGMQLLSGLEAAHRAGIVHRDIKPGNVFLLSTFAVRDLVKIVDFGIAKMVSDVAATSRRALTDFGQVLGTFAYMAPEQAMGGSVDARADIFAAGATLFHALSGVRPTEAVVPGQPRVPLVKMAPWVDPRLAAIVDKAMERRPEDRFASAQEMADALAPFADKDAAPSSMTVPEVAFRDTIKDRKEPDRFDAETRGVATDGGTALMAPVRTSQRPPQPTPSAPRFTPPPPQPHSHSHASPRPRTTTSWLPWIVGGVVAVIGGVVAVAQVVFAKAASSPAMIEQHALESMNLPPCPPPETCTTRREGLATYSVCTKTVPLGRPVVGTLVFVSTDDHAFAGYVKERPPDDEHIMVTHLTTNEVEEVSADRLSRLCR